MDLKFHPRRFAGFCWCVPCRKLVNIVETDHPNGLDKGPWTVKVFCHGLMYEMRLSKEAVADFVEGRVVPVPTAFFADIGEPRPMSVDEVLEIESSHGAMFDFPIEVRVKLNAAMIEGGSARALLEHAISGQSS